ncbi:MAG TPA: hypothetical protein VIV11_36840 [Kofleriaceae bacterium]
MTQNDLELRLARLERRTTIWQLVAVGSLLTAGVMITNACRKDTQPPSRLELTGEDGRKLSLDGNGLKFNRGDATISVDANGIRIENGAQTLMVDAGRLDMEGCPKRRAKDPGCEAHLPHLTIEDGEIRLQGIAGDTKLAAGAISLAHQGSTVQATAGETAQVKLRNGPYSANLMAAPNVSAVTAQSVIESPTEGITSGLYSDLNGATVSVSRIGDTKSLATARKK